MTRSHRTGRSQRNNYDSEAPGRTTRNRKWDGVKWTYRFTALLLGGLLIALIYPSTDWNMYGVWLLAWSITTFVLYGVDKQIATISRDPAKDAPRAENRLLHLLALIGGFAGGWLGMAVFGHKRRQSEFWAILLLATLIHGAIVFYFFVRPAYFPSL